MSREPLRLEDASTSRANASEGERCPAGGGRRPVGFLRGCSREVDPGALAKGFVFENPEGVAAPDGAFDEDELLLGPAARGFGDLQSRGWKSGNGTQTTQCLHTMP